MQNRRTIGQLITTFAFCCSTVLCFSEADLRWDNQQTYTSIIFWVCGSCSFIAIFRWQIADIVNWVKKKI